MQTYVNSFYHGILFIGGNEIGPTKTIEIVVSSVILVFAACFNAWLFSEMAYLIDIFSQKFSEDER